MNRKSEVARVSKDTEAARLLQQVVGCVDQATYAVLEAAMRTAIDVTHECGTPAATDAAILDTFTEALAQVRA
jgi:hypothetical protein